MAKELKNLTALLKKEKQKSTFMKDELQKKETLILRAMAARKQMHTAYLEEKDEMKAHAQKMVEKEGEIEEIHQVVYGRDAEIKRLRKDLARFGARIDEL